MIEYKHNFLQEEKRFFKSIYKKIKKEKDTKEVGYYTLPNKSKKIIKKAKKLKFKKNIKNIVIVGIGGSSLGTKAIDSFLRHTNKNETKLIFIENSDPLVIEQSLKQIKLEDTIFLVISKSGTTIETISVFKYILWYYDITLKEAKEDIIIITDKNSALWKLAKENNLYKFKIPKNVGGRFSVLSAVGMVPLTLAKYDTKKILKGAKRLYKDFF